MTLNCPVCKTKTLEAVTLGHDTLDKCPVCHGLWFNGNELGDIEELPETELMSEFQDQLDGASISESKTGLKDRLCPQCNKPMNSYQYDVSSGIWIQGCPDGEGVWLDKGEILKIHKHLQDVAKDLPPEKMKALMEQLKQIDEDEKREEEAAVMSVFPDRKGTKFNLPVWHLMDGVCRFFYHILFKLGV